MAAVPQHLLSITFFALILHVGGTNLSNTSLPKRRVVSVGDLHGDYESTVVILRALGVMGPDDHWKGGNTVLVQTGDIVDRGADSRKIYSLLHRLQDEAPKDGGRVILLLGNHELMNLHGDFRYVSDRECAYFGRYGCREPMQSYVDAMLGGGHLGQAILERHQAAALVEESPGSGEGILFVHAGLLPEVAERLEATGPAAEKVLNAEVAKQISGRDADASLLGDAGPLWSRRLALSQDRNVCRDLERTLKVFQAKRMIVGHTVQSDGRVGIRCGGRLLLGDTLISSAYKGISHKSAIVIPDMSDGKAYAAYPTEQDVAHGVMPRLHLLETPVVAQQKVQNAASESRLV